MTTIEMPAWVGKRSSGPNPTQRTIDNHGVLRVGETVFPREDNWISNTNWSSLKTCIQITQTEKTAFRNDCIYIYVCVCIYICVYDYTHTYNNER